MEKCADIEKWPHGNQRRHGKDCDQRGRPRQRQGKENDADIHRGRPGRRMAPARQRRGHRRILGKGGHRRPPLARSTSEVVEKPCKISTSITTPTWASTTSCPTTCSRV